MKIAKLEIYGEDIRKIIDILSSHPYEHNVDEPYVYSSGDITVLIREGFYFRISSTLVAVIIFKFINDHKVEIELVVTGGKNGTFMHSWGSEDSEGRSIVHEIIGICADNGWNIASIEPEDLKKSFSKSLADKFKEKIKNSFRK